MKTESEIFAQYEAELAAIAELDRSYYLNPSPTRAERAGYQQRLEQAEQIRSRLHTELRDTRIVQVRVSDPTGGTIVAASHCALAHDLRNYLGVILGRCELLTDLGSIGADVQRHVSAILNVTRTAATRLNGSACPLRAPGMAQTLSANCVRGSNCPGDIPL